MKMRIIGLVAAGVILYAGTLQVVQISKRDDLGEPAATAWVLFWTGWMPDSWSEAIAAKTEENFLEDRRIKRRLEERERRINR